MILKIAINVLILVGVQPLYPELLIVKRVNNEFVPLDAADIAKHGAAINDIVLKYEWPMCIASTLSMQEQHELLAPDKPGLEEHFIQKKIQAAAGADYCVAFIPTVLYELFCLQQIAAQYETGSVLEKALEKIKYEKRIAGSRAFATGGDERYRIDLSGHVFNRLEEWKKVGGGYDIPAIVRAVYGVYQDANAPFFNSQESAYVSLTTTLAKQLFEMYPELQKSENSDALSSSIEKKAKDLITRFVPPQDKNAYMEGPRFVWKSGLFLEDFIKNTNDQNIVARVIDIEYEARSVNKGFIFRASSLLIAQTEFDFGLHKNHKEKHVLGSTLSASDQRMETRCREANFNPYSSSFGMTLFAGMIYDRDASVFSLLQDASQRLGYAILINKQAYYKNNINNLLFIPPLAPIAGLLQQGEFFHVRAKAASQSGTARGFGMSATGLENDPVGFFVTKRDPLRHAQIFSNYLAQNGRIIRVNASDMKALGVKNETEFIKAVSENQGEAATFYGGVCSMKSLLNKQKNPSYSLERKKRIQQRLIGNNGNSPTTK